MTDFIFRWDGSLWEEVNRLHPSYLAVYDTETRRQYHLAMKNGHYNLWAMQTLCGRHWTTGKRDGSNRVAVGFRDFVPLVDHYCFGCYDPLDFWLDNPLLCTECLSRI